MGKRILKLDTALYPTPAVLVTSAGPDGKPNVMTVAWTGILCSDPPYVSISIRKSRYSYGLVKESGEFVINLTAEDLVRDLDYCGIASGRDEDKFANAGLTLLPASVVKAPLIAEAKVHLECKVRQIIQLGSHHVFVSEVVATQADESVLDSRGRLDASKLHPVAYINHEYWGIGGQLGKFGFTKKK